jgi:hypothetical protein
MGRGNPNWKPGVSGNPGGRVKGSLKFRDICQAAVDEIVIDAWIEEVTVKERVVQSKHGTPYTITSRGPEWMRASELLAGYGYGRPPQSVELTGDPQKPLVARELTDDELLKIIMGDK